MSGPRRSSTKLVSYWPGGQKSNGPVARGATVAQPVPDSTSVASTAMAAIREHRGIFVFCSPEGKALHNFERDWKPALQAAPDPGLPVPQLPAHVRIPPGDAGHRPLHGPAGRRLED